MKQLLCILIFILWHNTSTLAENATIDSLRHLAQTTADSNLRIKAYRDLADIFSNKPDELRYLRLIYQEAAKIHNQDIMLDALEDIALSHMAEQNMDSVYHYFNIIKQKAEPEKADSYLSYLRTKLFENQVQKGKQESESALTYESECLKKANKNSIYTQIEQEYVLGKSLYSERKFKEAAPHLENAYKLAGKLTGKDRNKYLIITGWQYANNFDNTGSRDECIELLETILHLHQDNLEKNYAKQRPFFSIDQQYLRYYTALLMRTKYMPLEKAKKYLRKMKELYPRLKTPSERYNCFMGISIFYYYVKDYPNAIITNDSLLKIATDIAPNFVPKLWEQRAVMYDAMQQYKAAYICHQRFTVLKDSLSSQETQKQINTMQVEYQVDRLKFEKTELENKSKKAQLITLGIILLVVIILCICLFFYGKREKRMKHKFFKLNQKAEESEKLKTEFLNSMCHEIRTPLNAIVGFSGIIVDETFDNDGKKEFYNLITDNTALLTSLIDHLLVVANLDSSNEVLPCQITNINDVCREEMAKTIEHNKKKLEYQLDLPQEDIIISTNSKYLALVIENLLSNAYKFTQEGKVTLGIRTEAKKVIIEVSDTGCGIPLDKQEVIFERFTKLDSFTQGNGLGLFLSRLIIKRLNGSIQIDPSYTDGSKFVISLPKELPN